GEAYDRGERMAGGEAMRRAGLASQDKVRRSRQAVERLLESGKVVYGVTTGFGRFADRIIEQEEVATLQRNIALSHAVGVGPVLDEGTVRALMLIRANTLAKGYSGVRLETLETLLEMINRGLIPIVPSQGSLGASGDLAPLAHMSLVLIGEGEAYYRGERMAGGEAMRRAGLAPLELGAKEGVALTNGTAVMTAIGALTIHRAQNLTFVADIAGALSLEALEGTPQPFDDRIHQLRPYPHHIECAGYIRRLLEGSELVRGYDPYRVQDAYSLRCIPQVHGAVRDAVAYAHRVVEIELNSANDNPLLFWEDGEPFALSGGNFHGEPVALAMDYLATAIADLGNISERRLARLLDPARNGGLLPAFLIEEGGVNCGLMLLQYTAAALASENKVLAHPASVDNIPTSANTEDHVSMGTIAARQAQEVTGNVETILALELMAAAQAIDFRRQKKALKLGKGTAPAYQAIREVVPFIKKDTIMYPYIEAIRELVRRDKLVSKVSESLAD
ncbi:MAG: histidine ammonia-lyase, partial [Anaerolineae bacterium]|nr:histidine ammonia-lyase [Anaerolineae bacterium]